MTKIMVSKNASSTNKSNCLKVMLSNKNTMTILLLVRKVKVNLSKMQKVTLKASQSVSRSKLNIKIARRLCLKRIMLRNKHQTMRTKKVKMITRSVHLKRIRKRLNWSNNYLQLLIRVILLLAQLTCLQFLLNQHLLALLVMSSLIHQHLATTTLMEAAPPPLTSLVSASRIRGPPHLTLGQTTKVRLNFYNGNGLAFLNLTGQNGKHTETTKIQLYNLLNTGHSGSGLTRIIMLSMIRISNGLLRT